MSTGKKLSNILKKAAENGINPTAGTDTINQASKMVPGGATLSGVKKPAIGKAPNLTSNKKMPSNIAGLKPSEGLKAAGEKDKSLEKKYPLYLNTTKDKSYDYTLKFPKKKTKAKSTAKPVVSNDNTNYSKTVQKAT